MVLNKILSREKTWMLMDQLIFSATSFISTLVLARVLGVTGFGHYSAIVLFLYLMLSISNALVTGPYQVGQTHNEDEIRYRSSVIILQMLLCLLLSVATAITYTIISKQPEFPSHMLFPVLLMMNGFVLQDLFRKMLLATGRTRQACIIDAMSATVQALLFIVAYAIGPITVQGAVLISGVSFITASVMGLVFIGFKMPGNVSLLRSLRWHYDNGRWLLLTSFLQWCSNNLLITTAGLWIGVKALGALRLAQSLFGVLNALLQVLENYAIPKAADYYRQGAESLRSFLRSLTKKTTIFLIPVLLMMLLFPRYIFALAGGSSFEEYAYALQGMTILYAVIFFGYPFRIAIRVMVMNRELFIAYCFSFAFTVSTASYLVNTYKLHGVIIALVSNQLLMIGYWYYSLLKKKFVVWK